MGKRKADIPSRGAAKTATKRTSSGASRKLSHKEKPKAGKASPAGCVRSTKRQCRTVISHSYYNKKRTCSGYEYNKKPSGNQSDDRPVTGSDGNGQHIPPSPPDGHSVSVDGVSSSEEVPTIDAPRETPGPGGSRFSARDTSCVDGNGANVNSAMPELVETRHDVLAGTMPARAPLPPCCTGLVDGTAPVGKLPCLLCRHLRFPAFRIRGAARGPERSRCDAGRVPPGGATPETGGKPRGSPHHAPAASLGNDTQ